MWRYTIPLAVFFIVVVFLAISLTLDPRYVPSPLIGKPTPAFELPRLHEPEKKLALHDLAGQVTLLNVWASWCGSCRVEHPLLLDISSSDIVPIYGLNYKDEPKAALNWLRQLGDPYRAIAVDYDGRVGIDLGVYGAPETYIIDKSGIIAYKQVGPITPDDWREKMLPLILQLQKQ